MADCRKCGSKKITRRRAGEYFCQRCGMQPGVRRMDRFGNATAEVCAQQEKAAE